MDQLDGLVSGISPIDQASLSLLAKSVLRQELNGSSKSLSRDRAGTIWLKLVATVLDPTVTDKHLTAACNCLSVFLLSAASSSNQDIRTLAFTRQTWSEGYECAWKAFDDGKTKPALQVLETLTRLLNEHPDTDVASSILRDSATSLLSIILTGMPQQHIKIACVAFSCLLRRTSLHAELEDVVDKRMNQVSSSCKRYQVQNNISPDVVTSTGLAGARVLLLSLLFAVRNLETRSAALKAIVQLCKPATDVDGPQSYTVVTAEMFQVFMQQNEDSIGDFADNVLPVVLDQHNRFETFLRVYQVTQNSTTRNIILWLAVLKVGRSKKFITESGISKHECLRAVTNDVDQLYQRW